MKNTSSRWIEPRQGICSSSSNPMSSSTLLNSTSDSNSEGMDGHLPYPRITSGAHNNPSSSVDVCLRIAHDSFSANTVSEVPFSESRYARKQQRCSHTKSRTGCFTCKRRRIKCDESRPSCTQCTKRRLQCEWPGLQIRDVRAPVQTGVSNPSMSAQMQSADAALTMQDFRLFYHFIQNAYPHHPIGNDSVWKHEIPSISHNYDYLLHAMLGLSASDLGTTLKQAPGIACSAMSHRVQAIKALNKALSNGLHTFEEGNAMLATCFVLLFQSVLLEDGLAEYMSFIRGCVLIAQNMGSKRMKFLFHSFLGMDSLAKMDPYLKDCLEVNPGPVNAGCKSLEAFGLLCQKDYERNFHNSLLKTARALYTSSRNAYLGLMEIYRTFSYTMSHEDFQHFIDPANEVGTLLQSHFVAVQLLLSPITINELGERKPERPSNEPNRWLDAIHRRVTPRMLEFFEWPISVAEGVRTGDFYKELSYDTPNTMQQEDDMSQIVLNETQEGILF